MMKNKIKNLPFTNQPLASENFFEKMGGVISFTCISTTIAVSIKIIKTEINKSGQGAKRTQPWLKVADLNMRPIDRSAQWEYQWSSTTSRTTAML